MLPGKGWMHLATGLGTGSRGGGSRSAHPTEPRLHRLRAPRSPRGRTYLGPLAAGAADVVAHPGRLVHAEAGGRAGKLGSAPAEARKEGAGGLAGPAPGLCPRPPGSARWRRSRLPDSKTKPETPPHTQSPAPLFLPRPQKQRRGEPGSARPRPPGPPRQRGGLARLRTPRSGRTVRAAPRCPTPRRPRSPARPRPRLPDRRSEPGELLLLWHYFVYLWEIAWKSCHGFHQGCFLTLWCLG